MASAPFRYCAAREIISKARAFISYRFPGAVFLRAGIRLVPARPEQQLPARHGEAAAHGQGEAMPAGTVISIRPRRGVSWLVR